MMPYIKKSFFPKKKSLFHTRDVSFVSDGISAPESVSDRWSQWCEKQNGVYFDYSFDIDSLNPSLSTDLETGIFCLTRGIRSVQG